MDDGKKLFIDRTKKEMKETLESGVMEDATQQYAYVDNIVKQLILVGDIDIVNAANEYFKTQEQIKKEIVEKQKEIQTLMDKYASNSKEIYEEIQKL